MFFQILNFTITNTSTKKNHISFQQENITTNNKKNKKKYKLEEHKKDKGSTRLDPDVEMHQLQNPISHKPFRKELGLKFQSCIQQCTFFEFQFPKRLELQKNSQKPTKKKKRPKSTIRFNSTKPQNHSIQLIVKTQKQKRPTCKNNLKIKIKP